jgi:hypothetical protein
MTDIKRVFRPRSGFIRNTPTDLSRETGIVAAYNFIPINQTLTDISGNSHIGTVTGCIRGLKGLIFNGISDKVVLGNLGDMKSVSFRIKPLTTTEQILEGAANDMLIHINAGTLTSIHFENIYINGIAGTTMVAGFWHTVTLTSTYYVTMTAATLALNNISYGAFEIEDLKFHVIQLTPTQIKEYHNQFAKQPYLTENFEDYTLATTSSTYVGFSTSSGTYQVINSTTDDPVLKSIKMNTNYLSCITSGSISKYSEQSYGTWEGDIFKADANDLFIVFIGSKAAPWNDTGQNGYSLYFDNVEKIAIQKITNGVASNIMVSAAGYLQVSTWYRYKITRSILGEFKLYMKGGTLTPSFGYEGWTLVNTTSGVGTNPATDTTFNASNYITFDIDAGDRVSNIKLTEGGIVQLVEGGEVGTYDDWFLPSKDELSAMYTELHLHGVGNFVSDWYWSSSENADINTHACTFDVGGLFYALPKGQTWAVHACRAFTSTTVYALRDTGPTGGLIFWKSGNDYLEAASSDQSVSQTWSNVINVAIGTTGTAIGTGQANTTAIIGQAGHITSAAKLCDDLVL